MTTKKHFLIPTLGYNATLWLGRALNAHPEIKCTMALTLGHEIPFERYSDWVESERLTSYVSLSQAKLRNLSIDDMFTYLSGNTDKPVVGEIHGVELFTYLHNIRTFGTPRTEFAGARLVRHPVAWIEAYVRRIMRQYPRQGPFDLVQMVDAHYERTRGSIHFDDSAPFDPRDLRSRVFYFATTVWLRTIVDELNLFASFPFIRLEDLKADPHALVNLIGHLSQGTVGCSQQYLESIYTPEAMKFGYKGKAEDLQPDAVQASWSIAERALFAHGMNQAGGGPLFRHFGYELA